MEHDAAVYLVKARNGVSFFVGFGVATAYKYNANSRTVVKFNMILVAVFVGHTFEKFNNIRLQTQHDGLSFGVAHTTIILNDVRFTLNIDEAKENKAFVFNVFGSQSVYSRTYDAVFNLLHPLFCGKGNRRYTTHASSV